MKFKFSLVIAGLQKNIHLKSFAFGLVLMPLFTFSQKFYLIGDAGEPKSPDPNLQLLESKFDQATSEDVLIFLGDNLYPKGLPSKDHPDRVEMENKLKPQLDLMKKFPGMAYIIPGNHDWAQGKNYGWERAQNMNDFIIEYVGPDVFIPSNSCPGPVEISVNEEITLIVINTQYFLHPWEKPGDTDGCKNKSTIESLQELKEIIYLNRHKNIIIAGHHPMFTYGEHHGNFSFKEHIFPFTAMNESLYIPLPIIGSIHPLYRATIGDIQDNTNPKYKAIMKEILESMNQSENIIYTSGHEHSLQYIKRDSHHFIVSGSGAKTSHVKVSDKSEFARSEQGFAIVEYGEEGTVDLQFHGIDGGQLYESDLFKRKIKMEDKSAGVTSFKDSTIVIAASSQYEANKKKQKWLGGNYRDVWAAELPMEVIDLSTEKGGLEILKKGGGMQTKSLRLEAENGKQYVLRSIEKYPENAIPLALRGTFAQEIVQDQISASHPYGAFIVPPLAEAAGIYHTNPKPVFIPSDPKLGKYETTFSGLLALYEERPNKEASKDPYFGGGKDVEGTLDVLEKLQKDNDHTVDQNFVVRNRLFDLWIGDWDRHDDQWRWAEFKNKNDGNTYRPIPRDRDQAFFINEGIIPKWAARKWALPKIEGFDEEVDWAPGLADNARFFDRTFMNEPDWQDWKEQIEHLQQVLTDQVIDNAIGTWPQKVQDLSGDRIKTGLRARRKDMNRYARELYLFLSKEVEVVGSDKHEVFKIERISKTQTKVSVFKRKKDGTKKQKLYERLFRSSETKEIRLFGRDGEDVFEISGIPENDIKLKIIGGTDKDRIINQTNGRLKKTVVYDRKKSTKFEGNSKGISRLSTDPSINFYNRKSFKYDKLFPLVTGGLNPDDGLFIGGGFQYIKNGWRKEPYAASHKMLASIAAATGAFKIDYEGDYKNVFGKWGLNTQFLWHDPAVINFFGVGNDTEFDMNPPLQGDDDDPIDYYRTRINNVDIEFAFTRPLGGKGEFYVGPGFRTVLLEQTENKFLTDAFPSSPYFTEGLFNRHNYWNLKSGINVDTRDNEIFPTRGTTAFFEAEHFEATESFSNSFTKVSAEWAFFLSARLPARLVIANRIGGAKNIGTDFEFFNNNAIGGRSKLRGTRRSRFIGESTFYQNIDIRLKLFTLRSYLFPASIGLVAFHDVGRVWADGEDSDTWHTGKGFGLWISPLNSIVVNLNYAFGEDENLPTLRFGFFF